MTQIVVLAGGLATRMFPLTEKIPKSLLEVAGRPFIDWQLALFHANGFTECVLCVGHLAEQIEAHVGDGERYGMRVRYAHEGEQRLGTGGAVRAALPLLAEQFLLTYGDSYLPFDYGAPLRELAAHPDAEVVMSVLHNSTPTEPSNVALDGGRVARYEKGVSDPALVYIDYGALAIRRAFIENIPTGPSDLATPLRASVGRGLVRSVIATRHYFEIGSPAGLAALDAELRKA